MSSDNAEQRLQELTGMADRVIEGVTMAAVLSKDMRDGESAVEWVKRIVRERETARVALMRVFELAYPGDYQAQDRLRQIKSVACVWMRDNEAKGKAVAT